MDRLDESSGLEILKRLSFGEIFHFSTLNVHWNNLFEKELVWKMVLVKILKTPGFQNVQSVELLVSTWREGVIQLFQLQHFVKTNSLSILRIVDLRRFGLPPGSKLPFMKLARGHEKFVLFPDEFEKWKLTHSLEDYQIRYYKGWGTGINWGPLLILTD